MGFHDFSAEVQFAENEGQYMLTLFATDDGFADDGQDHAGSIFIGADVETADGILSTLSSSAWNFEDFRIADEFDGSAIFKYEDETGMIEIWDSRLGQVFRVEIGSTGLRALSETFESARDELEDM